MTQDELKLALEAMESVTVECNNFHHPKKDQNHHWAKCPPVARWDKAITAIKEALAQPKKEPIAYINVEKRTLEFAKQIFWHTPTVANLDRIPLYTQRTWVGLTNEQIDACWNKDLWKEKQPHHIFAKAIESKIKELNT